MHLLSCVCQTYAWGKSGSESEVAKLLLSSKGDFALDEKQTYAELWMGTHPKGQCRVSNEVLSTWLASHPSALGTRLLSSLTKGGHVSDIQLPFLFKVLSVGSSLSIQVHPNKSEARLLHAADPKNYPDDNHKPEMAIALTTFELMCGFRPTSEIIDFLKSIPEFSALVDPALVANFIASPGKDTLRACFTSLMSQSEANIQSHLNNLLSRLETKTEFTSALVKRLAREYPGDVGCFAPYFLNCFSLQPGEAVFLGPNEPHAYLFGDCIECMACSDNTIRAGLTPKFKDVTRLCTMLTYRCAGVSEQKFTPRVVHDDAKTQRVIYKPPIPEFIVERIEAKTVSERFELPTYATCAIVIVIEGEADKLHRGQTVLVEAGERLVLWVKRAPFVAYLAYCDEAEVEKL